MADISRFEFIAHAAKNQTLPLSEDDRYVGNQPICAKISNMGMNQEQHLSKLFPKLLLYDNIRLLFGQLTL
ncbi:hypothetical protein KIN20_008058 [Parelaphostrongylus tenuis]|uniref:Uncharacterized protein n=1 Tax=Parelaphostrongylus tenuis TaxID=148309 RepID=A0AAD5MQK5_PARTN|nr:hypothetical protein KIN20_008058 [Parelaphostrongylus tenuis]